MLKAILISSLLFNTGLLLGRFSGFIREAILASSFGISIEADIAVLTLTVPDFLLNIMVGGGLAAALIPEFTSKPKDNRAILYQAVLFFGLVFSAITALLIINIDWFLSVLAPGFSTTQRTLSTTPMQWVLWLLPLSVITAIYTSYLQAHNKFGIAAMGTLIINTVIIAGLLFIGSSATGLVVLAWVILIGGLIRLLSQVVSVKFKNKPPLRHTSWHIDRKLIYRFLQVAGSGSILLCFPVVVRAFASFASEGSIAAISYATKLVELPLAITVTFLATVLFPRLSKAYHEDITTFTSLTIWGMKITVFLALISLSAILPITYIVTQLIYGRGEIDSTAILQIGDLLKIGLFYLPFMGLSTFCTAAFHAQKITRIPFLINIGALLLLLAQLGLMNNYDLINMMQALVISYGFAGITSLILLLAKMPTKWLNSVNFGFIIVTAITPALQLVFLSNLDLLSNQENSWIALTITFTTGILSCTICAIFIPLVRKMFKNKLVNHY